MASSKLMHAILGAPCSINGSLRRFNDLWISVKTKAPPGSEIARVKLGPGQAVWVPPGFWHAAINEERCVSFNVSACSREGFMGLLLKGVAAYSDPNLGPMMARQATRAFGSGMLKLVEGEVDAFVQRARSSMWDADAMLSAFKNAGGWLVLLKSICSATGNGRREKHVAIDGATLAWKEKQVKKLRDLFHL